MTFASNRVFESYDVTKFLTWLASLENDAGVLWDRDVRSEPFTIQSFLVDPIGNPTVYELDERGYIGMYEFVCDPVPHWRSGEDAWEFNPTYGSWRDENGHRFHL